MRNSKMCMHVLGMLCFISSLTAPVASRSSSDIPLSVKDLSPSDLKYIEETGVDLRDVERELQALRNSQNLQRSPRSILNPKVQAEAFMTTPQLIEAEGYRVETHFVTTDDGYILQVHRMPPPENTVGDLPPVFLQHGILCSSSDWIIAGPGRGLAYLLHDLGYDVWMGNFRGNTYSRNHTTLNPDKDKKKFWDFSLHEHGVQDLPAVIDYILEQTQNKDLLYIGHSMGTTSFFVMCSERPEYNKKVRAMFALAPVAFLRNTKSPLLQISSRMATPFFKALNLFGVYEYYPSSFLFSVAGQILCNERAITRAICTNIMFLMTGYDSQQLNATLLPTLLAHMPAGTSTKNLLHFGQFVTSDNFGQYDYGYLKNPFKYGSLRAPQYDLSKVEVPVSLHFSDNDWVAQPKDVEKLREALPNLMGVNRVPYEKFNHLDFLWAIDVKSLVYDPMLEILEREARR